MQIYETFSSFGPLAFISKLFFVGIVIICITKQIDQHYDILYRVFTNKILLTDWEESHVSDVKVPKFRLARSARSQSFMCFSRVSVFLVGINHHEQNHITSVTNTRTSFIVPTNHVIYQQNIEENRMFQTQIYHKFRLARNIAFSLVSGFPVG